MEYKSAICFAYEDEMDLWLCCLDHNCSLKGSWLAKAVWMINILVENIFRRHKCNCSCNDHSILQ